MDRAGGGGRRDCSSPRAASCLLPVPVPTSRIPYPVSPGGAGVGAQHMFAKCMTSSLCRQLPGRAPRACRTRWLSPGPLASPGCRGARSPVAGPLGGARARRGEGLFVSLSPCVWTHSAPPAPCPPLTPGHKGKAVTEQPVAPSPCGPTNTEKTGPAALAAGGEAWESRSGKPCVVGQHALTSEMDLRELLVWGPR